MKDKRLNIIRYFLIVVVILLVVSAYYYDVLRYLTLENMAFYKEKLGWWAPLVFMFAFALGELLQIPSVLWIFFDGLIWPIWLAFPVALISAPFYTLLFTGR